MSLPSLVLEAMFVENYFISSVENCCKNAMKRSPSLRVPTEGYNIFTHQERGQVLEFFLVGGGL